MSEPAEGWYADPTGAAQLRWWDGHAWTQYVEPYEATPAQSETAEATPAPYTTLFRSRPPPTTRPRTTLSRSR